MDTCDAMPGLIQRIACSTSRIRSPSDRKRLRVVSVIIEMLMSFVFTVESCSQCLRRDMRDWFPFKYCSSEVWEARTWWVIYRLCWEPLPSSCALISAVDNWGSAILPRKESGGTPESSPGEDCLCSGSQRLPMSYHMCSKPANGAAPLLSSRPNNLETGLKRHCNSCSQRLAVPMQTPDEADILEHTLWACYLCANGSANNFVVYNTESAFPSPSPIL